MPVKLSHDAGVAYIALDWPGVRNALGPDEAREVKQAIETACTTDGVKAAIVCSSNPAFCSGGNLPAILNLVRNDPDAIRGTIYNEFQGLIRAILNAPVPVIAAVDGPAIGLGCDIALACDVTFVGSNGWLTQGWMAAGLVPAPGGTYFVTQRAGRQNAWRFLTAGKIDGPKGEALGLCIAANHAMSESTEMAHKLAEMPTEPLRVMRRLIKMDSDFDAHVNEALDAQVGFLCDPTFEERMKILLQRAAKPRN